MVLSVGREVCGLGRGLGIMVPLTSLVGLPTRRRARVGAEY